MSTRNFAVVTVGASAGGIEALRILLQRLPSAFPIPIAVVLHRSPRVQDILPTILSRSSALPVQLARAGGQLKGGIVYVAPSDHHLTILPDHTFAYRDGVRVSHTRSAIDPLFKSAAHVYGPKAIALVLSGGGTNGVRGACAVRDAGGTVIAQDPEDAAHPGMPIAAVKAGAVKYILPLERIADALTELVETGNFNPERDGELVPP